MGADAASGLAYSVVVTPANVHDVTQAHALPHGEERDVFADAGYQGVDKRKEVQRRHPEGIWHVAMRPANASGWTPPGRWMRSATRSRTSRRASARGERIFGVPKCVFRSTKVRDKGLRKNAAQTTTLLMLANLWMVRRHLVQPLTG